MGELVLVLATLLIAVVMGLSLAHALEFPGKLRLDREAYMATQTIYYPGFTIGGMVGEAGGLLAVLLALIITPVASERFSWLVAAFALLVLTHATYWLVTHPVNAFWLRGRASALPARGFSRRHRRPRWTGGRSETDGSGRMSRGPPLRPAA